MHYHPRFRTLFMLCKVFYTFIWLGMYGADSAKATRLWSNIPLLTKRLFRKLDVTKIVLDPTAPVTITYKGKNGRRAVDGGQGLKRSQTYPPEFGKAVAEVFHEWCQGIVLMKPWASIMND